MSDLDDLVGRWDLYDPEHERLRVDVLRHAREHRPVAYTSGAGGFYLVTRYEDVRRVLQDWETFSSEDCMPMEMPVKLCPITADPPLQSDLRDMLNPLFSRKTLLAHEPMIRRTARSLVDAWADAGEVELVSQFAAPFVGTVLMNIVMGEMEPEERELAAAAVLECSHHPGPDSFFQLAMCSAGRLATAESDPERAGGVVRELVGATTQGRPLTDDERLGVLNILFLGGLDTTRAAISMMALRIAADPSLEARVRDPGWVRRDLDEFLRIDSPVATFPRVVMRDVELGGVRLRAGERVLVRFDSANRDATRFPDPDRLVFDPAQRPSNAAFGLGVHRCVGSQLARIQIPVAWEEIWKRVTNLRLAVDPDTIVWEPGISNGPLTCPLRFDTVPEAR